MGFEVKRVLVKDIGERTGGGERVDRIIADLYADGWRIVAGMACGMYGIDRELWLERPTREERPVIDRSSIRAVGDYSKMTNRAGAGPTVECSNLDRCSFPACDCPQPDVSSRGPRVPDLRGMGE